MKISSTQWTECLDNVLDSASSYTSAIDRTIDIMRDESGTTELKFGRLTDERVQGYIDYFTELSDDGEEFLFDDADKQDFIDRFGPSVKKHSKIVAEERMPTKFELKVMLDKHRAEQEEQEAKAQPLPSFVPSDAGQSFRTPYSPLYATCIDYIVHRIETDKWV